VGKYNLDVVRTILVAIVLQGATAYAESAVLECISSTYSEGKLFVQFRMTVAPDWKISKASLLLHTADGTPPKVLEVGLVKDKWSEFDASVKPVAGKTRKYDAAALGQNWIRIELDPAQAQQITNGLAVVVPGGEKANPFHLRESMQYSPYLLLEGKRKD
jgi:hypothetical protein